MHSLRCNRQNTFGDRCLLASGHNGDHVFDPNNPTLKNDNRCPFVKYGGQCILPAGHPDACVFSDPKHAGLDDFKSGNEPELPAPPKPIKRLSIGYSEKGKGKIVLCCVPQVADTIRAANVGTLCASIDPAHAMEYTLFISIDLFDFDGMVDWLISLA